MKQKGSMIPNPVIDIVVAVAGRGGAENCINTLGKYLHEKGMRIRVIQMIYEGVNWTDECFEFHHLYESRNDHDLKNFIDGYVRFLNASGAPNLIIAIAWPMMSYVAKRAVNALGENIPVASWLHAPLKMYELSGYGGSDFIKYADIHFAISNEIAGEILESDPEANIYRVNNPVDLYKVHLIENAGTDTLLFVGRLSGEKNIGIILCAMAVANTKWQINIIGDGDEKEKLIALCDELNISKRVHFKGWDNDPWKYAEKSTALILSSMYEGSPLVAIEALSCGLPVIANVSSRVNELITPGRTGYLYEDENVKELANILDMISTGVLPKTSPEECRSSVSDYRNEVSVFDFYVKIYSLINGRLLSDHLWTRKAAPIIKDKISIVIPCYNVEKYLPRCLDSVLNQSIGLERMEIIAVNDCSTDSSLEILKEYEEQYPQSICIVDCPQNGGLSFARNTGLKYISGKYVTFIDSDDCVAPYMLEQMFLAVKCYPCDVISCDFTVFENDPPAYTDIHRLEYELILTSDLYYRRTLFMENSLLHPAWGKLFRTDFLQENSLEFPEGLRMEDIYFIYTAIATATSWFHITSSKPYYYFRNPEGIMRSSKKVKYYMDIFHVFCMAVSEYKERGLFDSMIRELEFAYYKNVYRYIFDYLNQESEISSENNKKAIINYMKSNFPNISENRYLDDNERFELANIIPPNDQEKLRTMSIIVEGQKTIFDFSHTDNTSHIRDTLDYIKNYFLPKDKAYDISVNSEDQ